MGSLFSPSVPKEDPALKAQRDAASARADAERLRAIQEQLSLETSQRRRGAGMRSLLGPFRTVGARPSVLGAG